MRKRKRKTLKYMRLSLLCFGLHACSLLLVVLAVMIFTFYLHMMVNGRVYRYMTLSERKEKKSENKEN